MSLFASNVTVAGVDACKKGWIAVSRQPNQNTSVALFEQFGELVSSFADDAVIVVDMPIGLPNTTGKGGRGAERAARVQLSRRRSSVFSIPCRQTVYLELGPFDNSEARRAARRRCSEFAKQTSSPSRGVTFQAFSIFPKIRQIDELLQTNLPLRSRVFESHPELAFWRLNGEVEMHFSKKSTAGATERSRVLASHGIETRFLNSGPPPGASRDDLLDAAALMLIADRVHQGAAKPFPDPPILDAYDIPVAIWA